MILNMTDALNSGKQERDYHKGVVVDINDPLRAGRVRALVEGRLEVPADQFDRLPWLSPDRGTDSGGRIDTAGGRVVALRSEIKVRFPDDDPYRGVFTGSYISDGQFNEMLYDNYPYTRADVQEDGSWTRSDVQSGMREDYRSRNNTLIRQDSNGDYHLNLPGNVFVNIGGKLDIRADEIGALLDALNISTDTFALKASVSANMRANVSFNMDAPLLTTGSGVSDVSSATLAQARISGKAAALRGDIDRLERTAEAMLESGRAFNEVAFREGIVENAEPTLRSTGSYSKPIGRGRNINLLDIIKGRNLLQSLLEGAPQLRSLLVNADIAVQASKDLLGLDSRARGYLAYQTYDLSQLDQLQADIDRLDDLLDFIGAQPDVVGAARANQTAVTVQMANINAQADILLAVQASYEGLPELIDQLDQMVVDSTYENEARRQQLLDLALAGRTQDVSLAIARFIPQRDSLQQLVSLLFSYLQAADSIAGLNVDDPIQLQKAAAQMSSITSQIG